MLDSVVESAQKAGDILLKIQKTGFLIDYKADTSPVTIADQESSLFLIQELKKIKPIPVLSEESLVPYNERRTWDAYWMIDPLDGTKEFIKNQSEFCINITLMQANKPTLAVIYAPALKELHTAVKGQGTFHQNVRLPKQSTKLRIAISRFHHSEQSKNFLNNFQDYETVCVGASLKFGRMAIGQIDIYPRFQGSSEWDIAAGHLILQEAGGNIIDLTTHNEPLYNKEILENNHFFAYTHCASFCENDKQILRKNFDLKIVQE
ncbi:MAG: 3'(2'),5'-bisphosphate nucleotidase CysQ [Holosporales bacterium]